MNTEEKEYIKYVARKDYRKNPSIKTGFNFFLALLGIKTKRNIYFELYLIMKEGILCIIRSLPKQKNLYLTKK